MRIEEKLLRQAESDLGLNTPFVKGQVIPIRNCYHFSTDGKAVDAIFEDDDDFIHGMNRVYVVFVSRKYRIIILAFSLMDTHVHFVLYGTYEDCNSFVHEYIRRTSMFISRKRGDTHKLDNVPIHHQVIDTDRYLKTVICYTVRNAPVAGLPFNGIDYPWSSGPLYFRRNGYWSSPRWMDQLGDKEAGSERQRRAVLKTRDKAPARPLLIGGIVFPGEYVACELVERIFKTCKSYHYFMSHCREDDVDSRGGELSMLSIPMQEMRQHKNRICREMFGTEHVRRLDTTQRMRLARTLRSQYNSSPKQVCRLCGLVYEEVKDRL